MYGQMNNKEKRKKTLILTQIFTPKPILILTWRDYLRGKLFDRYPNNLEEIHQYRWNITNFNILPQLI